MFSPVQYAYVVSCHVLVSRSLYFAVYYTVPFIKKYVKMYLVPGFENGVVKPLGTIAM
jgi:hypothetical protein